MTPLISPRMLRFSPALGALALTGCYTPTVDFMPRVVLVDLTGNFASTPEGAASSGSNDVDVLGLSNDDQVAPAPRIDLNSGRWDWTVDWIGSEFDGRGIVQNEFTIDGVTFETGASVQSDAELGFTRALVTYDFMADPEINLGLGLGASIYQFDAQIVDVVDGDISDTDQLGILPYLAGRAGWRVGDFDVQALVTYLDVEITDIDARYLDADAFARWTFRGRDEGWTGAVVAGYRWIDLDANYEEEPQNENLDWELRYQGPYMGLSFGF